MSGTGEYQSPPQQSIGTSTPVTIGLVVSLFAVAAGAGAALWRITALEKEAASLEVSLAAAKVEQHRTDLRLQRTEDAVQEFRAAVVQINAKLDRISGTRPARGEGR